MLHLVSLVQAVRLHTFCSSVTRQHMAMVRAEHAPQICCACWQLIHPGCQCRMLCFVQSAAETS